MRSQPPTKSGSMIALANNKKMRVFCLLACHLLSCLTFNTLADTAVSNAVSESVEDFPSSTPRTKIYFYNPEISTARNLVLKNTWDEYLYEMGPYEFQPIENQGAFKEIVHREDNAAFIMAEWLYSTLFLKEEGLELAFTGLMNGEATYQKVLVSQNHSFDLEKVTIACSGTYERASEVLQSIYPELSPLQINKINLLLVPKDIDALMAVGYGLAEMALTTELGLSKMALLNQNAYKDMVLIKQSRPLKRSVLVFKSTNKALKESLARAFMDMSDHAKGRQAISLIGLDEWKVVDGLSVHLPESTRDIKTINGGHNNDK